MSALHNALQHLNSVITYLEKSVDVMEKNRVGEQRDMFAMPSNENAAKQAAKDEAIAARLDSAIETVEKILAEDAAA